MPLINRRRTLMIRVLVTFLDLTRPASRKAKPKGSMRTKMVITTRKRVSREAARSSRERVLSSNVEAEEVEVRLMARFSTPAWVAAKALAVKLVAMFSSLPTVRFSIALLAVSVTTSPIMVVLVTLGSVPACSKETSVGISGERFSASSSLLYSSREDTVSFKGLNSSVRL